MEARGRGARVSFDGSYVTIARSGWSAPGKGEKRIPVQSITAVRWKPAGLMSGYIQFTVLGGSEVHTRSGRQTIDAARDENSVVFARRRQPDFQVLREAVEQALVQPRL